MPSPTVIVSAVGTTINIVTPMGDGDPLTVAGTQVPRNPPTAEGLG